MKTLTLFLICFPTAIFGQDVEKGLPTVDGKIKFVNIVDAPGINKGLLFTKTQAWISQNLLKNDQSKINVNDPSNGIISGLCLTGTLKSPGYKLTYTVTCKDNKYRLEIENLEQFLDLSSMTGKPGSWRPLQPLYDNYLKRLEKGKEGTNAEEKSYAKVRADIKALIIDPLQKHILASGTDF